ncbi:inosine-uridine nucleoside N-ribohydrolase [Gracilibacillus halotolerans]|uniref:Inosine-uridine nucleoside N-ribohydrolase n=1 Tax=Gracilibacillus halotolerans TaxID=74386 RepID=A0A841RK70_9BACI|nr:nucleoside hydrolase [Gracilibacillus halotolerans]MBB6512362.1 inosine-uridine nucleoside N-ribohydrolase [Gracilibacillus halotolerans]
MEKRKIIIDTDPGIDDTYAIIAALKYEGFDVQGITVVAGNVGLDNCVNNALGIVNLMDAECLVYPGAEAPLKLLNENKTYTLDGLVHGESGLGTVQLTPDFSKKSDTHAVDYILETVKENPGEIEIIALGPLTNIALAIQKDKETMKKVKKIWSMGGGVRYGNRTPVAEFNYWADPEAAKVTYDEIGEEVEISMIGLDVTQQTRFNLDDLFFLRTECGELGALLGEMSNHYMETYWNALRITGVIVHDLVAVMLAIDPSLSSEDDVFERVNLQMECEGICAGQSVVQFTPNETEAKNATVYMGIDNVEFKKAFFQLVFPEYYTMYKKYILS